MDTTAEFLARWHGRHSKASRKSASPHMDGAHDGRPAIQSLECPMLAHDGHHREILQAVSDEVATDGT